jgi:hypothetical protein
MDVTPNIEVSLIVQPGDTRYLAPRNWGTRWYGLKMAAAKQLARPYFRWKRRSQKVAASDVLSPPL